MVSPFGKWVTNNVSTPGELVSGTKLRVRELTQLRVQPRQQQCGSGVKSQAAENYSQLEVDKDRHMRALLSHSISDICLFLLCLA